MNIPKWFNSLRLQVVLLLTLALLPLGMVAIYQTARVEDQAVRNGQLALLALTGRAAKEEELVIQRGIGVARLFASLAEDYVDNPAKCAADLQDFLSRNPTYSFIGIVPPSGIVTCGSQGDAVDVSGDPVVMQMLRGQSPSIVVNRDGPISGRSIFAISEPFMVDDAFAGFITISIPHGGLPDPPRELTNAGLVDLLTLNEVGEIVTARSGMENANLELPAHDFSDVLKTRVRTAFSDSNQGGQTRTYTLFPIDGSSATVLGVWAVEDDGLGAMIDHYINPAVFPVLMWLVSMAVAMLSIYVLVSRHISRLRRNMALFAATRRMPDDNHDYTMPNELQELTENFETMTQNIIRDEAEMEDVVRAKNVLIKEVHHRVKNNLQLISSIMNMQIRRAEHEETKTALHRLQDRVLSLATIHRDLYQSQNGGLVDAGALMKEVVEKAIESADVGDAPLEVHTDIDKVWLYPDQAVPLSLMTAEAMTNAMKYLNADRERKSWVEAKLKQFGDHAVLTITNTIDPENEASGTGLGAQLINAFAIQLGGQLNVDREGETYIINLQFPVEDFKPDLRDF